MPWILSTIWEVFALCLAVWIVVKHLYELQRSPTGWVVRDCFTVLMRTHVVYFARCVCNLNVVNFLFWSFVHASFVAVSCLDLGLLFPSLLVCPFMSLTLWWSVFITFTGLTCRGISDLFWHSSNSLGHATVCARTTPHPWCSTASCWGRGQLRCRNRHDSNVFPAAHPRVNWQWCIVLEVPINTW